jgi:hypothetical protein
MARCFRTRGLDRKRCAPAHFLVFAAAFGIFFTPGWRTASAQFPTARPSPASIFARPAATPAGPPREVPLVEKKWEDLANHHVSSPGQKALALNPDKWKHAETPNFILHYRRITEAQKVAREIEYDIWFIARTLGAKPESYAKRSHVFVFEDEEEWRQFLASTEAPSWFGSFARGDELFLNVRRMSTTGRFDSYLLAHETTHAVVSRLYPRRDWPLWLNEGFAEYMAGASVAARKNQTLKRHQQTLEGADLPLETLIAMQEYPGTTEEVARLYRTSEKLIRFLMSEGTNAQFIGWLNRILAGTDFEAAVLAEYGGRFKDFETFKKKLERFDK